MKKIYLLLVVLIGVIFITGCGSKGYENKSTRTVEDLLEEYIDAYTKPDVELAKDLFPSYYVEYAKDSLTTEKLEKSLKESKERYGDDFTITYEIKSKTKFTDEELDSLNEKMASYYNSKENASECYKINGTITFKGSKDEDPDPLKSMAYCKYNDGWFLVGAGS